MTGNGTTPHGSLYQGEVHPPRTSLKARLRRLVGLAPEVPEGRRIRADGRFEDCWGDCGENGVYCCDGLWDALRKATND